jgi:hypothetical protein
MTAKTAHALRDRIPEMTPDEFRAACVEFAGPLKQYGIEALFEQIKHLKDPLAAYECIKKILDDEEVDTDVCEFECHPLEELFAQLKKVLDEETWRNEVIRFTRTLRNYDFGTGHMVQPLNSVRRANKKLLRSAKSHARETLGLVKKKMVYSDESSCSDESDE